MKRSLYHQELTLRIHSSPTQRGKLRVEMHILSPVSRDLHVSHANAGGESKNEVFSQLPSQSPLCLLYHLAAEDVLELFVYGENVDLDAIYFQSDEECQHLVVRSIDTDQLQSKFLIEALDEHRRLYSPFSPSPNLCLFPWLSHHS